MNKKILIVGGYGQVGGKISNMLISKGNPIIVAGRSIKKAERFTMKTPEFAIPKFIVMEDLEKRLQKCSQFHIYSDAKSTI